jgi:hypothetical protein
MIPRFHKIPSNILCSALFRSWERNKDLFLAPKWDHTTPGPGILWTLRSGRAQLRSRGVVGGSRPVHHLSLLRGVATNALRSRYVMLLWSFMRVVIGIFGIPWLFLMFLGCYSMLCTAGALLRRSCARATPSPECGPQMDLWNLCSSSWRRPLAKLSNAPKHQVAPGTSIGYWTQCLFLSLSLSLSNVHTHTHYIYIYIFLFYSILFYSIICIHPHFILATFDWACSETTFILASRKAGIRLARS